MRPHTKQYRTSGSRWLQKLTATTVLVISALHSSIPTKAQEVNKDLERPALTNQASFTYTDSATNSQFEATTAQLTASTNPLIDPFGKILGCSGQPLTDYTGFSVGLYETNPNDPTGTELGPLIPLTPTELPDNPNNNIPAGKAPNINNTNPYFISNNAPGEYSFLFDEKKGQTDVGRTYILVINPPQNTIYQQRRIKIEVIGNTDSNNNKVVQYTATSLDGQPITSSGGTQVTETAVFVPDAEIIGLNFFAFNFATNLCQRNQTQIIKTGDRAAAEPGDTVIYRISVKNSGDADINNVVVTDNLPLGFNFLSKSVQGEIDGQRVTIDSERNGSTVTFRANTAIPQGKVLNIAYATQLTTDAIRGTGRNSAIVNAQRVDNSFQIKDGPATHHLKIRPGITSDCGTIIGRVFVDKNFDGEQQPGEPGIPNAVIFLEDGNRITTDPNGLFSVANVLPGNHTGALDLSSLPGYTLAPNVKFRERNSQSRLVRLAPGGMVRMNFAVTPTFQEQVKK
jgi:uncharacterized repeat protein (TIGR01451 family)